MFKLHIWGLLVLMLVFSGCTQGGGASEFGFNQQTNQGGSSQLGLSIGFLQQAPPFEVNQGAEFPMRLVVENYGDARASEVRLRVTGYERGFVSSVAGQGLDSELSIPDVSGYFQERPGTQIVDLGRLKVEGFSGKNYVFSPRFNICYRYTTRLNVPFCVPALSPVSNPVCTAQSTIIPTTHDDSPLKVDSIKSFYKDKSTLAVQFAIANRGQGKVRDRSQCFEQIDNPSTSLELVGVSLGTKQGRECKSVFVASGNGNTIDFFSGETIMECLFDISQDQDSPPYSSQISLELAYYYESSFTRQVNVINPYGSS